jgi:hypothetical protein
MLVSRILRNFAVLAILTVIVFASTPRAATAQGLCVFSRFRCSGYATKCSYCGGGDRCCWLSCYDPINHRYCIIII